MREAKNEAEEAARNKPEAAKKPSESSHVEESKPSAQDTVDDVKASDEGGKPANSSPSRSKHHKTNSEVTREATFASLQRTLDAAVAYRDTHGPANVIDEDELSPTTVNPPNKTNSGTSDDANFDATANASFSDLGSANDSSFSWTSPASSQDPYGYGLNGTVAPHDSFTAPTLDATQGTSNSFYSQNVQFCPQGGWSNQLQVPQAFPGNRAASDTGVPYTDMHYPSVPQSEAPLTTHQPSTEFPHTLEGIGIHTESSQDMSLPPRTEKPSPMPKQTGKELDIAARRKRPRPAAIGTPGSGRSTPGTSTLSPTARMPSVSAGQNMRHSKSAHNLGARYAGVRKASAAQRSPLNVTSFAEAGALHSSKAEMSSKLQPSVTSTTMAPPTPLTPEALRQLYPTSPSDGGYCLSAAPTTQFFTTQPMGIELASPPTTPLPADVMSQFSYPGIAPPMSAPAQRTTFADYAWCEPVPMTARSWADTDSIPSPNVVYPGTGQVQHDISPVSYDPIVDHTGNPSDNVVLSEPPSLTYPAGTAATSLPAGPLIGKAKTTDFVIHEFPEQQEAHRYAAQQLPSRQKNYTFTNQTPTAYGSRHGSC